MLFSAVSSRCFSDSSRRCASRCSAGHLPDDQEQNERRSPARTERRRRSETWSAPASRRVRPRRWWSRPPRSGNGSIRAAEPSRSSLSTGLSHAQGLLAAFGQHLREQAAPILKLRPIIAFGVGMTRQHRSVAMEHGDRGVLSRAPSTKRSFSNFVGATARETTPRKFAVRPGHLAGDHRSQAPGKPAANQFDLLRLRARFEGLEVGAVGDVDGRNGEHLR